MDAYNQTNCLSKEAVEYNAQKNGFSFNDEDKMNGYDMMCDLVDYLGEWAVLNALSRYLSNDELVEAMKDLARDYDYSFDGE